MHQSTWRSEDGQLLRSLREQAGIDEHTFARANTLSISQLRELEEGGHSSFYNPGIKRSTGVKLLKKLGHVLPLAPEPPTASSELTAIQVTPQTPTADATVKTAPQRTRTFAPTQTAAQPGLSVWWMGLVLLAALLGMLIHSWDPESTESTHAPPLAAAASLSAPASAPVPALVPLPAPTETPSTPVIADPQPLEVPPPNVPSPALICDWQQRGNSQVHTPIQPLKPGNYVYLEAQADIELCVLDSQNQQTQLQLKAGTVKSVYGTAPFWVQSQDWESLKLFFQGRRVQVSVKGMQHLQLNSQAF